MPAPLAFHVLGPLQVTRAGAPVTLGGPRERVLLAALLVEHGRVVSVDGLAQALWGDHPPATARHQVAIGVSRLRKALTAAGAGPGVIATCAPGYRVADGWLDTRCFEERARQAHEALAAGDREEAARLLRAGLSLWRGPALSGIDRPFAEIEAARLEERRLMVTEEHIGLELDLGRHEVLVGDLFALVRAHPLRERLRGLLMLALHRAGRRAEALAVYQDGRRQLVDTLGVEPGPQLRAMHQALLRDEPAWDRAQPRRRPGDPAAERDQAGHVPPVPAQLPPDVRGFTGRRAELDALDQLAVMPGAAANGAGERPLPIGIIAGVAGVGKTGLVLHWGHRARHRFPDGQLYADLRGYDAHQDPLPPAAVLDGFLRALGVPGDQVPSGLDERAALFRSMLHGRQMLIVLDNARTPEQVRPLLPGSSTCLVLVSSRDRLDDLVAREGARLYALDVLGQIDAGDLLSRMAGDHRIEPATADRIAALCDRLPLALRIAAARLAIHPHHTPADLADRLADEQRRLAELSQAHRGVRASFALSYRALPSRAALLFRLLGLLDAADAAAWTAAALLGGPEHEAEDLLDQLVRAGLLEVSGRDRAGQVRYRLHDLMRLYARERAMAADSCAERDAAAGRFFGTALHLAERADHRLGNPFVFPLYDAAPRLEPDDTVVRRVLDGPVAWFEAERTLLTGAVAQAARLGMAGYACELTSALGQFLSTHRYSDAGHDCATRAIAAARAAGHARGEAAALLQYADCLGDVGRYGEAIRSLRRALALVTSGDTEAEAACRALMAVMLLLHGQAARAEQEAQHALTLFGRSAPPAARARALVALGLTHLNQGRYNDAAACFTRVLRIQQAAGSVRGQAEARYRLGTVRLEQGRYAAAVRLLTEAMRSAGQAGDLMNAMTAQIRLGQAFLRMGRLDDARPLLDHAVRHVTPEGAPRFRAIALEALGQLHQARQQPDAAAPLIAEAAELRQALAASGR
jgi:DNA-binding SARP family transcriptional activator/tetratricopeptide (TPR) repeat protein